MSDEHRSAIERGSEDEAAGDREAAVMDMSAFMERCDNDPELADEVIGLFLTESSGLVGRIRDSIATAHPDAVVRTVHSLRGYLIDLSAARASEAARELEEQARLGNLTDAPARLEAMEREMRRLNEAIASRTRGVQR